MLDIKDAYTNAKGCYHTLLVPDNNSPANK